MADRLTGQPAVAVRQERGFRRQQVVLFQGLVDERRELDRVSIKESDRRSRSSKGLVLRFKTHVNREPERRGEIGGYDAHSKMPSRDKWIAGPLPKRGGTAPGTPAKPSQRVLEKLARANKKLLVGRPLAVALRRQPALGGRGMPNPTVAGAACLAIGIGGLAIGMALAEPWLLLPGGLLTIIGGALLLRRNRVPTLQLLALVHLRQHADDLDAYLEAVSPRLPQEALGPLAQLKETLAEVLPALDEEQGTADVPREEFFFAEELVSRYVPDACRHYLSAVEAVGASGSDQGAILTASLCRQLDILQGRLQRLQAALAAGKAQRLANHEAFIKSKQ